MHLPRALNLLREGDRHDLFTAGLVNAGFDVTHRVDKPEPGDLLVIWNRIRGWGDQADHFERNGARVLVAENCPLGNGFRGGSLSIAQGHVAMGGGAWAYGGPERWDSWGVELAPFRVEGKETLILAQRGIGHRSVASPPRWAESIRGRFGGRIREHPGTGVAKPLAEDLVGVRQVMTWSSAAALQALMQGVPVWYAHPGFVGAPAARPLAEWPGEPKRDDEARLAVFRRLAWAMWTTSEIERGLPFGIEPAA